MSRRYPKWRPLMIRLSFHVPRNDGGGGQGRIRLKECEVSFRTLKTASWPLDLSRLLASWPLDLSRLQAELAVHVCVQVNVLVMKGSPLNIACWPFDFSRLQADPLTSQGRKLTSQPLKSASKIRSICACVCGHTCRLWGGPLSTLLVDLSISQDCKLTSWPLRVASWPLDLSRLQAELGVPSMCTGVCGYSNMWVMISSQICLPKGYTRSKGIVWLLNEAKYSCYNFMAQNTFSITTYYHIF